MKRLAAALLVGGAGILAVAGCSADSGEALVVYSGRNEALIGPVLEQFTDATGIPVEVRYGNTAGMAAQLLEEGDQTPADVFISQDAGALGAVANAGLFSALPQSVLEPVPAQYRATEGDWVGVTGRARVIVYNPELAPAEEIPGSVYALTEPTWTDRVAIAPGNASFQSFVTGMRVADGEDTAQAWLDGVAANGAQTYEGNISILDAVDAGEIDLGLINHYYWFERAEEVGEDAITAQLAYTEAGDPGSLVNVSGVGVLAGAATNPDALELVDYLLSEEGQRYFADVTKEYPLIPTVPPAEGLVPLAELQGPPIDLGDLDSLPVTIEMIQNAGLL